MRISISRASALCQPVEPNERAQQRLHLFQGHHVGTIGWRLVGILMGLDEHASDADRDGRARED